MRNRANQLKVAVEDEGEDDDENEIKEEEWEKLLNVSEGKLSRFEFEFPKEKSSSILILSYVGPQHG